MASAIVAYLYVKYMYDNNLCIFHHWKLFAFQLFEIIVDMFNANNIRTQYFLQIGNPFLILLYILATLRFILLSRIFMFIHLNHLAVKDNQIYVPFQDLLFNNRSIHFLELCPFDVEDYTLRYIKWIINMMVINK